MTRSVGASPDSVIRPPDRCGGRRAVPPLLSF